MWEVYTPMTNGAATFIGCMGSYTHTHTHTHTHHVDREREGGGGGGGWEWVRNVAGEGRQLRGRDGLGHCEQLVRPYILAFIHRVLVPLNFKNRCVNWVFTDVQL